MGPIETHIREITFIPISEPQIVARVTPSFSPTPTGGFNKQ